MHKSITVIQVCIPHSGRDTYDYYAEEELPPIGARVLVPFGKKTRIGLVTATNTPRNPKIKLRAIISILDAKPLLPNRILHLCTWISAYYQSPLSEVLPLALPKKYREGREVTRPAANKTGCKEEGQLPTKKQLILNQEQQEAVQKISHNLASFQCFLLHGVTGSGKTEVYLQVIAKCLDLNQQVLVLVPEIGLTPQLLSRFQNSITQPIMVIHSHLNESERATAWQMAADNQAKLIIGTRSAIFTPMPALGLIIIDEEHDSSLKQMDSVRYSARDTALMRAFYANIPIILGSATPSLESLHNCFINKYQWIKLKQKALNSTPLTYNIIDIRNQSLQHGLAKATLKLIEKHLSCQNQVLVFINRRGFAPVLLCHQCAWIADCHACDTHMTVHRKIHKLICHHCGFTQAIPLACPKCQSTSLLPIGAGTQRIHTYLQKCFPTYSICRIDRDEIRGKNALNHQLNLINSGEAQLIVGTQMLAKGHHFPRLTLVVILDADHGLYNPDFRAVEKFGQLLTQVAGRAGRASLAGEVVIQTHYPQHPYLQMLLHKGYESLAKTLLENRKKAQLPPYESLALIRAQGKNITKVLAFLHNIKGNLQQSSMEVLGPAPAPLARKAGFYRLQLLIKSSSRKHLNRTLTDLRSWVHQQTIATSIRWNIDVDPIDLT